jgi:hypothetical protein
MFGSNVILPMLCWRPIKPPVRTSYAIGSDDTARVAVFHAGYRSAISTLALFFGISPAMVLPEESVRAIEARIARESLFFPLQNLEIGHFLIKRQTLTP